MNESRQDLFRSGLVTLSSGIQSRWKIDCDTLTDGDIATLATMALEVLPPFGFVEGVPTGGLRLARELARHVQTGHQNTPFHRLLIVDDVLTTGASMERQRAGREATGFVLFARGPCPPWVAPLFTLDAHWVLREREFWVKEMLTYNAEHQGELGMAVQQAAEQAWDRASWFVSKDDPDMQAIWRNKKKKHLEELRKGVGSTTHWEGEGG